MESMERMSMRERLLLRTLKYDLMLKIFEFSGNIESSTEYEEYTKTRGHSSSVMPQMITTDFYSGGMAGPLLESYDPARSERCRTVPAGRSIQMENIFAKNDDKVPPGHVTVVGPAGSGKTTLLQRYARNFFLRAFLFPGDDDDILFLIHGRDYADSILEKGRKNDQSESPLSSESSDSPGTSQSGMPKDANTAIQPSRRDNTGNMMTLGEFLFVDPQIQDPIVHDVWLEWMAKNPTKITFLIDSIDTLPFSLSGTHQKVTKGDEASPATFLFNIMTGSLFPGAKVLSSSREYAIADFEGALRADRIIALVGLSEESREKHISFSIGREDSDAFISDLKRKYPGLWALCSTPVFLNFTLLGRYNKGEGNFSPTTMSGVVVNLLQNLLRSKHGASSAEEPSPAEVLDRLKMLAFEGIRKKKVTFEQEDLEKASLNQEMVTALSISVPGRYYRILKGDKLMFFCHQSVQELLAALYILQMEEEDFVKYNRDELHKPDHSIVRRFVSGLLLHEEVHKHALQCDLLKEQGMPFEAKREAFVQELSKQLSDRKLRKYDKVDLYITLHEAGGGSKSCAETTIKSIDLVGCPLRPSDLHAIGTAMNHCKTLKLFDLSGCEITGENLSALAYCVSGTGVTLKNLCLKSNSKLGVQGFSNLGMVARECKVERLNLGGCGVTSEEMQALTGSLGTYRLDHLSLEDYYENKASEDMVQSIISILPRVAKTLDMKGWMLEPEDVKVVKDELQKIKTQFQDDLCVLCGEDGDIKITAERMEDVFEEAIRRVQDFKKFARVTHGLALDTSFVRETFEDNRIGPHEQKIRLLTQWESIKGKEATPALLRQTVDSYFKEENLL